MADYMSTEGRRNHSVYIYARGRECSKHRADVVMEISQFLSELFSEVQEGVPSQLQHMMALFSSQTFKVRERLTQAALTMATCPSAVSAKRRSSPESTRGNFTLTCNGMATQTPVGPQAHNINISSHLWATRWLRLLGKSINGQLH